MQGREPEEAQSSAFAPGRLAVIDTWGDDLDAESASVWKRVTQGLPSVKFPPRKALNEVGFTVLLAEAAAFHRHWLETVPERYGRDVLEPLQRGLAITRREYVAALLEQSRLRIQADAAMEEAEVDALVVPATRIRAPLIGQPFERLDLTGYTRPFNTTGQPAICLPAPDGDVPIGIQLVGRHGEDLRLLAAARSVERQWAVPFHQTKYDKGEL
jgi:aspartyl-tRNA(Asn)/glutamyl-tRNA(Gln) amidotransferase subunit A